MTYANQFSYDNDTEPSLSDYQDEPEFAEFAEYVTIVLLRGHDWQNLSSGILMIDLGLSGGGYQMAVKWVCERITEDQFKEFLNE